MAARQYGDIVIPILLARAFDYFSREMDGESRIVAAVDEFRALSFRAEQLPIAGRTDTEP